MTFYCYHCDELAHQCKCGAMDKLLSNDCPINDVLELYDVVEDAATNSTTLKNPNWSSRRKNNKINPEVLSFAA